MDYYAAAAIIIAIAGAMLHLERRLTRLETDVRWIRDTLEEPT